MKCPLCQSSRAKIFCSSQSRDYQLCSQCGLIFVPPRHFLSSKEEVGRYLKHQNSLESEGYVKMFHQKIDVIAKFCPKVKTVLDYGCGYEPVLKTLLNREGYTAEGYDPNFFQRPILTSKYDMVVSTETFEHFKEPGKEIDAILNVLSPEGFIAVMTKFYPQPNGGPDPESFGNWYYQRDPTHICFYSSKTFKWIAQKDDCKIIYDNQIDFIILQKNERS